MATKARVLAVLENADHTKSCCECGFRYVSLRLIEKQILQGVTEVTAYCFPCSKKLLADSPGDPRV
jgi:hypothetical protein